MGNKLPQGHRYPRPFSKTHSIICIDFSVGTDVSGGWNQSEGVDLR